MTYVRIFVGVKGIITKGWDLSSISVSPTTRSYRFTTDRAIELFHPFVPYFLEPEKSTLCFRDRYGLQIFHKRFAGRRGTLLPVDLYENSKFYSFLHHKSLFAQNLSLPFFQQLRYQVIQKSLLRFVCSHSFRVPKLCKKTFFSRVSLFWERG